MGMALFSKLSSAFKARSQSAKKAAESTASDASETGAQSELDGALAHHASQSKRNPIGRSKSLETPKPTMRSGTKRAVSLPATKLVHRPHKPVLPKKARPVDAALVAKAWPPTPSPVRKMPARKSKTARTEIVTQIVYVPKGAELRLQRRAYPYGAVWKRSAVTGAELGLQSDQKLIDWVQRTGRHGPQKPVQAGLDLPQSKTAITYAIDAEFAKKKKPLFSDFVEQILANRPPRWADVPTEHRTALLRTLELGIQCDTSSPRVAELWLDLLSRLDELGWNEHRIGHDFMEALFALDAGKPSAASSAVAIAWVCAMEAEMWREDCGGIRNLVLENNPYFFWIQNKVNAYMDAHHGASNAAPAEATATQTAICDDATFEALIAELQAPTPDLNAEIDELIAEFETMKR